MASNARTYGQRFFTFFLLVSHDPFCSEDLFVLFFRSAVLLLRQLGADKRRRSFKNKKISEHKQDLKKNKHTKHTSVVLSFRERSEAESCVCDGEVITTHTQSASRDAGVTEVVQSSLCEGRHLQKKDVVGRLCHGSMSRPQCFLKRNWDRLMS